MFKRFDGTLWKWILSNLLQLTGGTMKDGASLKFTDDSAETTIDGNGVSGSPRNVSDPGDYVQLQHLTNVRSNILGRVYALLDHFVLVIPALVGSYTFQNADAILGYFNGQLLDGDVVRGNSVTSLNGNCLNAIESYGINEAITGPGTFVFPIKMDVSGTATTVGNLTFTIAEVEAGVYEATAVTAEVTTAGTETDDTYIIDLSYRYNNYFEAEANT